MHRNRFVLLFAALGIAALVVVVAIIVGSRGGGGGSSATSTSSTSTSSTGEGSSINRILRGVPQNGDTLGRTSAPASLLVFEDPQCPYCRDWSLEAFPTVVQDFVRTGQVKLVYRGIAIIGPNSIKGLRAINAAGNQGKLWNLTEALYGVQGEENSGWITDDVIKQASREVNANGNRILRESSSQSVTKALTTSAQAANLYKVAGTPTFVLEQPPALPKQLQVTGLDAASFSASLSAALQ